MKYKSVKKTIVKLLDPDPESYLRVLEKLIILNNKKYYKYFCNNTLAVKLLNRDFHFLNRKYNLEIKKLKEMYANDEKIYLKKAIVICEEIVISQLELISSYEDLTQTNITKRYVNYKTLM